MTEWTERMSARVKLAKALKAQMARSMTFGMVEEDLDEIIQQGEIAEEADLDQRAELAQHKVSRSERSISATKLKEEEDGLRDRLLPVVGDLERAGQRSQGLWLSTVSFARFRIRDLAPAAGEVPAGGDADDAAAEDAHESGTLAEAGDAPQRVRVERQDAMNRFRGLAGFCRALLAPERVAIVARLEARGFSQARLEALGQDAKVLADLGRNLMKAAEATAREAEAAGRQQRRWRECRRMIRKACVGDAELAGLLAAC